MERKGFTNEKTLKNVSFTSVPSDSTFPKNNVTAERIHLKRRLGVHHGVAIIVGLVVGSGIWVAPRGVMAACGSPALTLLVWLVGGLFATLGAFCSAELGTTFPESGGRYIYLKRFHGTCPAFLFLWAYLQALPRGLTCQDSPNKAYAILCIAVVLACTYNMLSYVTILKYFL